MGFLLQGSVHGYALLSAILTTLLFASRLAAIKAFPYTFIVVEIWACRISFCCTPIGAPVSSSQER
jgi:hypothetical protein